MHNYIWTLGYVAILNSFYVIVAFILWYHLWVKKLGVEIPIPKKIAGLEKRHLYYNTTSPSILYDFFKQVLTKFDRDYWIQHCGQDAYLYLLFQRKMIVLSLTIAIPAMVFSFSINLFIANDQNDWFEKSSLNNTLITPITAWIHVGLLTFFTIITFYFVFDIIEEAKEMYSQHFIEKCKNKDYEWLKARTLHVRGLLPKDRRGDMLKNELNIILKETGGKVLDVVVIPDFQNLFDLEIEKKELEDLHILVNAHGEISSCTKGFYKLFWQGGSGSFDERKQILESQIQSEIEKPFLSSGHAFVVLDSVKSLNYCLQQCKMTPTYAWKLARLSLKENVKYFFVNTLFKKAGANKEQPTFNQFVDEDLEIAQGYREKDLVLVMNEAGDPVDFIWRNLGGTRGVYFFRKFIFNFLGLLLVLFFSTPAAIYSSLKVMEAFNFLDVHKMNKETFSGTLIITLLPPLVIITINNVLLYMIDYAAYYERRASHSKYQFSIFNKCYIYLSLNMLLIPAATMTNQVSIIELSKNQNYNIFAILALFYQNNSGVFFVSMLIQNACLSICINLVRPGEISYAFFSPWLAHYRRKYINDNQAWRRKEGFVFLYGYYYAMQLIIFTIMLVFASTVPLITIGGLIFFLMRHLIDSFNLLTVNKKEIDSSSKMYQKILLNLQLGILLYQLCMISYFTMKDYKSCAAFLFLVMAITLIVIILNNKNLFDLAKQDQAIFNDAEQKEINGAIEGGGFIDITEDSSLYLPMMKWRQEYSHPLMITREQSEITQHSHSSHYQYKGKNSAYVGNIVEELKGFDEDQKKEQKQKDYELKEMVFAGSSSRRNGDKERERIPSIRQSKANSSGYS